MVVMLRFIQTRLEIMKLKFLDAKKERSYNIHALFFKTNTHTFGTNKKSIN